jgi:hypothetical protein
MAGVLKVLSLGVGVQSTTILRKSLIGPAHERPDLAIFSNTQWESRAVYDHLATLKDLAKEYDFPIIEVTAGNIREDALSSSKRVVSMPLFVQSRDGKVSNTWFEEDFELEIVTNEIKRKTKGAYSKLRRQCTREYKLEPINRAIREYLGYKPGQRIPAGSVEMWIGISTDEIERISPSRKPWITNRYPLIEWWMSRLNCVDWLIEHGFPVPPKSSCIGCPFHDDAFWRDMKINSPLEFEDACLFDDAVRHSMFRVDSPVYLHRSLKPLRDVDFSNAEDNGQLIILQGTVQGSRHGFVNECQGVCGV